MPCPFANILGEPKKGVHSIRIFGFSFIDFLLTGIAAYFTSKYYKIDFLLSFTIWFVVGEILHYVFGVKTAFLEKINLIPDCR